MVSQPSTTQSNGRIVVTQAPSVKPMALPQITGSIAEVAAAKTASDAADNAAAFKALGAGQKGGSRRRSRGRRYRGGASTVQPVNIPTAGSIPGQNPTNVGKTMVETLAQLKASSAYDKLTNAQPVQMGGFKLRGAEDLYPGSGTQSDTKGKRKTKKKHGRSHRRTHRGKRRKHRTVRRRRSRRV